MTEPTDTYSDYFDEHGQPVRRGVVLSPDEQREYELFATTYFGETAATTEETA